MTLPVERSTQSPNSGFGGFERAGAIHSTKPITQYARNRKEATHTASPIMGLRMPKFAILGQRTDTERGSPC